MHFVKILVCFVAISGRFSENGFGTECETEKDSFANFVCQCCLW